jgi:mannan endo-1,4-beta-mannosidase
MDAYVREFSKTQTHDDFYTDQTIRGFFENYLKAVVSRYVDSTTLLGWELANDPRCSSSIASSPSCTTETITLWHSEIAQFIVSIDPNHLVTSGFVHFRTQPGFPSNFKLLLRNQGFFCADCPKLFFGKTPAPPAPSPAPGGGRKRAARGLMSPSSLFQMITKERRLRRRASTPADGIKIRGRWSASCTYPFTTHHLTF